MTNLHNRKGFTLIELMIAIGLFAFVMTIASGAYLTMIGLNQHAESIATGVNDLSFALETMTREIRTGTQYSAPSGNSFSFTNSDKCQVTYNLSNSNIFRSVAGGSGCIVQTSALITDQSVTIASLMFYPSGTVQGDAYQPNVLITISGSVSVKGKTQFFTVETGATMRGIDI